MFEFVIQITHLAVYLNASDMVTNFRMKTISKIKGEGGIHRLSLGEKVMSLAAADDFLRMNESDDAAKKNRRWRNDAVTEKQWGHLKRLGYGDGDMFTFTKYSAACTLNFFWNRQLIEKEMENGFGI